MRQKNVRTPETYTPQDEELIRLVAKRPGISLRELCGEVWPELRWYALRPSEDSASQRVRRNGQTAAQWLKEQMDRLVRDGRVRATRRRDEVDDLAANAYEPFLGRALPWLPCGDREPGEK